MESPYEIMKETISSVDKILELSKREGLSQDDKIQIFLALVLAERLIDIERTILPAGSSVKFPEDKAAVEESLKRTRVEIWSMRDDLEDQLVIRHLDSLGDGIKLRFLRA